jgi:branched-chain amino acid transport system substrate-binding protein
VAVFRQNDSYGQAGLDGVVRALKAHQLEPVAVGLVERNTVAVSAAVQAIMASKPDAIVQISAYKSCAAFVREARKAGFGGTFYNVSFVGTQALSEELGADARGVAISQVMPFPFQPKSPIAREFLAAVQRGGAEYKANYSSIEGYVAAKVFAEGLKRAGKGVTRDTLIAALESMQSVDIGGFVVNYNARRHVASQYVDLTMLTEFGGVRV